VAALPDLWRIVSSTGRATLIGPTHLTLDGGVEMNGKFYAFYLPNVPSWLVTLDLANGNTTFAENVDPAAGLIFGAAPTPEPATLSLLGIGALAAFAR
jgi:hypothetical protein